MKILTVTFDNGYKKLIWLNNDAKLTPEVTFKGDDLKVIAKNEDEFLFNTDRVLCISLAEDV